MQSYLDGIEHEMQLRPLARPAGTIFIGGGTPGVLSIEDWSKLGRLLHDYTDISAIKEWTVEMAPSTVHPEKLALLKEIGVTRISVGVQSFQQTTLESLGRRQPPSRINKALEQIRDAGFHSWNMDLMFALPNQTWEEWERDMRTAMDWAPHHISTYCLTLEEDTPLYLRTLKSGKAPTEEQQEEFYRKTWAFLERNGYAQYEISNFSRPNHHCIHNLHTWDMQEWIGIGPSAASQHQFRRWQNIPDHGEWRRLLDQNKLPEIDSTPLTNLDLAADALVFGLRMNQGVDLSAWSQRFAMSIDSLNPLLSQYQQYGLLEISNDHIRLTIEGRLVADAVGSEILTLLDP
jgi:oxygen-independent coproporphyrinogen-3 oxidase